MRIKIVKNRKVDALIYINKASILRQLSKNASWMQHTYTQRSPSFFGLETVTLVTLKKSQNQSEARTQTVVYHLQKYSRKSGSKVNGARLFGSSQRKISGSNGTCEKVVLFFGMEYSNRKLVIHFFKVIFDTSFRPSRPFSGKWICFVQMVNAIPIPGRSLQSWTLRTIYPNREPKVLLFIIVLEFPWLVLIRHYAKENLTRAKALGKKVHSEQREYREETGHESGNSNLHLKWAESPCVLRLWGCSELKVKDHAGAIIPYLAQEM